MDFIILEEAEGKKWFYAINTYYLEYVELDCDTSPGSYSYIKIHTASGPNMRFPGNYTFGCCNTPAEAEKKYESLIRHLKNGNAYALGNISGFASDKIDFMRLDDEHRLIPTNKIRFIYTKPYPFEDENEGKYMAVIEYTCTYEGTASTLFDTKEGAENQCREWVSACVEGRMFEQ